MNREDSLLTTSESRVSHRAVVAILLVVAAALRLYQLSSQSIWVDEMLTLSSSGITAPLYPIDIIDNLHGPLHSIILFLWTKLAGESEFALRLPSVLFSVLSLIVIYRIILRLTDSGTAIVALALMAVSPVHVWYAQEVRNYSLLLFFSALSFDSYLSLLAEPGRTNFGKYVLFTFAGFLCNMSMAFLLIVQDVLFFLVPRKLSFRHMLLANVLVALLLAPWLKGMFERVEFGRLVGKESYPETQFARRESTFTPLALPYTFYVFSVGYSLGPGLRELHDLARVDSLSGHLSVVLPSAICFALAFLLGLFSLRDKRKVLLVLLIWLVVPLVMVSLFAVRGFKPFNPRYAIVALPAYVFLLAAGLRLRTASLPANLLRSVLIGGIIVLSLMSLWNHYHVPRYQKEDFRAVSEFLNTEFVPGDAVFVVGTYEPIIYYCGDRIPLVPLFPDLVGDESRLESFILEQSSEAEHVWLVTSRLWYVDPERRVQARFMELFGLERELHFEGVGVSLFVRQREARIETLELTPGT